MIEKAIFGPLKRYMAEFTLLAQQYVVNPDLTVTKASQKKGAEVTGFARLKFGYDIEDDEDYFLAQVAKLNG
ncbi:MAG: hypothetical protein ABJH45_17800 [Paracoccaceae bacterium]